MPEGLGVEPVVDALARAWGFGVELLEYAPVGAGSYHWRVADATGRRGFVTVDDLDQKAWLGDTRESSFDGLRRAFETAIALRDSGLPFVVAPLPTRRGEALARLDERHSVALFPFLEGEAGEFGAYASDEDRLGIAAMLASLHGATVAARTVGFDLPGRAHIEAALREHGDAWSGGPLSEPAREAVGAAAAEIADLLALADRLAAAAQRAGGPYVVTHGEPHAANVMRTREGLQLLDWDTVAIAPPERDLWMLAGDGADAAGAYEGAAGRPLDRTALDYFRLTWDLKDLAEYLNVFRATHEANDDTVRQIGFLAELPAIHATWLGQQR